MIETIVRLASGRDLRIECREPPLPAELAGQVEGQVGRFLREEYLRDILIGRFAAEAHFEVGTAGIGNRQVGTCWAGWGRGSGEFAVMGGVTTLESFQGLGVATALVAFVCEQCDRAGVRLLYLGAISPAARHIYGKLGFAAVAGNVLCRTRPGAKESSELIPGLPLTAGAASWRDVAAIVPLYMYPHECAIIDSGIAFPSTSLVGPTRCVRIFWEIWQSIQGGGRWQMLRAPSGCVVASAPARWTGRNFLVDFVQHPHYSNEAGEFIAEFLRTLEADSGAPCEICIDAGDEWKRRWADTMGFNHPAGAGPVIELAGRRVTLLRLRRDKREARV